MDKMKKMLLFGIPTSICNFRCTYCYIAQRPVHYEGLQADMKYTPEQVAYACRPERLGGLAFMNFCADGETLLSRDIDLYVRALVERGHYAEVVTNLTITPMLDKFLSWPENLRARTEFKCSFHYLQLKKHGLLQTFVDNVHKVWDAGASANIEVTPHDELVPYVDEMKEFSLENFGAFPHITIARDDRTKGIDYLTSLPMDEYDKIWGSFDSDFWKYKKTVFGVKQTEFCYAGLWSAYINIATGNATSCYGSWSLGNVFENPDSPFPVRPVGKCKLAHCYNAHAFLTVGCIPGANDIHYGNIRNRQRKDGGQWLQPELLSFFNTKLEESNELLTPSQKSRYLMRDKIRDALSKPRRIAGKVKRLLKGAKKSVELLLRGGGQQQGVIDPVTTARYNFQLNVFGNAPHDENVIVMLGDSLTENTPFNELMSYRHRIKNRGISSDNTQGVLQRIDESADIKPAKMFVLLGINDIGNGIPLAESMKNYREIIRRVREISPSTKIYVQSLMPVDHKKLADNARCRRRTSAAIVAFNAELLRLASEMGCEFVDTYSVFADGSGEMDKDCTFDGLHLNGVGMARWVKFLEKYM